MNILQVAYAIDKEEWNIVVDGDIELYLPGLIYMLIKEILKMGKERWIVNEIKVSGEIHKMTINKALKKIEEIFKEEKPVIFLDECHRKKEDKEFRKMYGYLRRAIRMMGLIPIFMGTNANLANFIDIYSAYDSRIEIDEKEEDIPWFFLVHRLSATSRRYIENKKRECKEIAAEKKGFVDMISKALVNERPLFVSIIYDTLIKKLKENERNEVIIVEAIIEDLMNEYRARKRYMIDFKSSEECTTYNFCNLVLMSPEFWRKNVDKEGKKEFDAKRQKIELEKAEGIHRHIAYLYVPRKVKKMMKSKEKDMNFFGLSIGESELVFSGIRKRMGFKREQTFLSFMEEPFSQLSFIGKKNYENIFIKMIGVKTKGKIIKRERTFNVGYEIYRTFGIRAVNEKAKWSLFETLVGISSLIASHDNGE